MRPMFLPEVEQSDPGGAYAHLINELRTAGHPVLIAAFTSRRNDCLF